MLNNISGSTNVCAAILQTVVGEAVEVIQQGGNQFALDGTVPDVMRPHVINRTRWLWLVEFPQMKVFQTDDRRKQNEEAVAFFMKVSEGKPKIAPPANPAPGGVQPIVTMPYTGWPKLREFRKCKEDGI